MCVEQRGLRAHPCRQITRRTVCRFVATDVADLLLVRLGVPFRQAHGIVAGLVRTAVDAGKPLRADS